MRWQATLKGRVPCLVQQLHKFHAYSLSHQNTQAHHELAKPLSGQAIERLIPQPDRSLKICDAAGELKTTCVEEPKCRLPPEHPRYKEELSKRL